MKRTLIASALAMFAVGGLLPLSGGRAVALSRTNLPPLVSDNLRELNNKLARAISAWEAGTLREGDRFSRTIKDLETTKLRAVDGFPETFGLPYSESFVQLSCIDEDLAVAGAFSRQIPLLGTPVTPHEAGTKEGFRRIILQRLKHAKACKDTLEVLLGGSGAVPPTTTPTTTAPPPTTTPKPSTAHAYRGPIDNGVFLADGNGSQIKMTVDSRRVRITFGTDFRYVCQGNQTLHTTGKRTQVNSFDFHPGWAWHPISPGGGFSITLFHHVLAGQFVSATTVRGTFTFEGVIEASNPTPTECHGNHSWTATLGGRPPAGIGPIEVIIHHVSGPIGKGEATRRDALFQDYLQRQGYVQAASNPSRASDASTGKSAVWNRDLETWDDAKTGQHLSGSGNDPAVLAYVFWQLDLVPKGFTRSDPYHASNASTGEIAVFDLKKLQWVDAKTGAGLSRSGR